MEQMVMQSASMGMEAQLAANPAMADFQDIMEEFIAEQLSWENIGPPLVTLYAETFSEPELREMIAFYRTPTGRKLVAHQPELMQKAGEIGEQAVMRNIAELQRRIFERMAGTEAGGS